MFFEEVADVIIFFLYNDNIVYFIFCYLLTKRYIHTNIVNFFRINIWNIRKCLNINSC